MSRFRTMSWTMMVAAGVACIAVGLPARIETIRTLITAGSEPVTETRRTDSARLFDALAAEGLITAQADGTLLLPPSDWALVRREEARRNGFPDPVDDAGFRLRSRLVRTLHFKSEGWVVLTQAHLYNRMLLGTVAVRDDWSLDGEAAAQLPRAVARPGERPNRWSAVDRFRHEQAPANIAVPERLRRIAAPIRGGFGDWRSWLGVPGGLTLRSSLKIETARIVTVHLVGRLNAERSRLPAGAVVTRRCRPAHCAIPAASTAGGIVAPVEIGSEIRLPLSAGTHEILLAVEPLPTAVPAASDLALVPAPDARLPVWRDRPIFPKPPHAQPHRAVTMADGQVVIDADTGLPTVAAEDHQLLPLLGYGREDPFGLLVGLTAGTGAATPGGGTASGSGSVTLTVDPHVQRATIAALDDIQSALRVINPDDPFRDRRWGALSVLDLDSGAILAQHQFPTLPAGVHVWDLQAARAGAPADDPLRRGQTITVGHTLGSILKVSNAYAAVLAAPEHPEVDAMLRGCAPDRRYSLPCLGLDARASRYLLPGSGKWIENYRHIPLDRSLTKPRRARQCGGDGQPSDGIGIIEALRDSLNVYQVRLAQVLDGDSAKAYDEQAGHRILKGAEQLDPQEREMRLRDLLTEMRSSWLVAAAGRLGFFDTVDLAGEARKLLEPKAGEPAGSLWVMPAEDELADLMRPERRRSRTSGAAAALSQAAIGHRVRALPIQAARMMAGIATGILPTPHLIRALDGQPVDPPPGRRLAGDLTLVRLGLAGVPQVGTAASQFGESVSPGLRKASCAMGLKTGTATASSSDPDDPAGDTVNSAWTAGWVMPEAFDALASDGKPAFRGRIAVACVVSDLTGPLRTGGMVCARVIARLMLHLAAEDQGPESIDELMTLVAEGGAQ